MGRKENPLLVYYNQNERFAQLLNGWLFRGRPRLEAGDIKEADRRAEGKSGKSGKRREYRSRYRDLYKRLDSAAVRLYVGAEPMEYVDYAMPLRVMDSDTLSYLHQKKEISRKYAEHKGLEGDEYLSRFTKKDRLLPVVTLVLYCGERPWDGARSLHGMLELDGVPEELKEYVEDYSLHILDVCHTPDERLREFPPEICFLLMCIKYAGDKEALLRLRELAECSGISEDTCETVESYLDMPEFLEHGDGIEEGGKINMTDRFRKLLEEERQEGREEGREEGVSQTKKIFKLAGAGASPEEIARQLSVPEERVLQILE